MRGQTASPWLPQPGDWPDAGPEELARRTVLLQRIAARMEADGLRHAVASPARGRQFLPFAALQGYDEMVAETMREARERDGGESKAGYEETAG